MEGMVKGYLILVTGRMIDADERLRNRIPDEVLEEMRANAANIKDRAWRPRAEVIALWRAIAEANDDEASARSDLVRCGEAMGDYATGSFLKLLLRVLTPRMFASKFPDLWAHDHQGGSITVPKLEEKGMTIVVNDVEGFDHIAVTAMGLIHVALRAIGLKEVVIDCPSWSLANPGPREATLKVKWK
jgi:hypothetical protein